MSIYCIYLTVYLGDKLPPFYIGSTSIEKINKGYHGSVTSAKYKDIWKEEIKTSRHLFKTFIIPTAPIFDQRAKLDLEARWQRAFDVVRSELFVNKCLATHNLFCTDPESIEKGKKKRAITYKTRGKTNSLCNKGKKWWNNGIIQTLSHECPGIGWIEGTTPENKRKNSEGQKRRKPISDETRKKLSEKGKGRKLSEQHKNKVRAARIGIRRSDETRAKMSQNMKGRTPWNKGKVIDKPSSNAKACVVISPNGERYSYPSMRRACLAHNLSTAVMCSVRQGKMDNYKGWRVEK